jgi:glycosyltransferase involved in cell wall biosynthesis
VEAVDRWLVVSDALRDALAAGGVSLDRARIVPAGIDLPALPLAARRPWRRRLLYVGRLSALKGVDVAIAALAHLPRGTTLEVVGDGAPAYRSELQRLARRLGVDERVRFRGPQAPSEVAAAYGTADAVLFPARWEEPWGLVPLEAMARGTPVVATGTGGSASYLRDGVNALLVAPDAPDALAAAVRRLECDAGLRDRLRGAGRRTAEAHPAERASAAVRAELEAVARQAPAATDVRSATSRST